MILPHQIFLLIRRARQRAYIAATWQRVQATVRLKRSIANLTIFDDPVPFAGGTIARTGMRVFTVIDANGNPVSFAGKTSQEARERLLAWLAGEGEGKVA